MAKEMNNFPDKISESDNLGSWKGTRIKDKNGRSGTIIRDIKTGAYIILTVRFDDNTEYKFNLNNKGPDEPDELAIQWEFAPDNFPGKFGYVSDNPIK